MRRALLAALALSVAATALASADLRAEPPAGGGERPDLAAIAREVFADDGFQKVLVPAEPQERLRLPRGAGDILSTLAWVLLWVGIAVALVVSGAAIAARLRERRARAELVLAEVGAGADGSAGRTGSLAEAERLAAAGAFTEAVHELLLVAVDRLAARRDVALPHSLTARELLHLLTPAGPLRGPFREIVATVEVAVFGGRDLGDEDWRRCRAACGQVLA